MAQLRTPATLYRGGTSKALIVEQRDLPTTDRELLEHWLLAAFGAPDAGQIDGVGGGDLLTSKFAIVGPPTVPDADVDYTFAQVGTDRAFVDWTILCGNISSAIGPFAIEAGYVAPTDPLTTVRVHNTNTGRIYTATVETADGVPRTAGQAVVDGVPLTGSPIELDFRAAAGAITGHLLPTGRRRDRRHVAGVGDVDHTVVDMTGLFVFAPAEAFGLSAAADPRDLEAQTDRLAAVEALRVAVGRDLGIDSPITPAVILVGAAEGPRQAAAGRPGPSRLRARCTANGRVHRAYPITGTMATGVAASLRASVVSDVLDDDADVFEIQHPSGSVSVTARTAGSDPGPRVEAASVVRTARRIFDGMVSVEPSRLPHPESYRSAQGHRP